MHPLVTSCFQLDQRRDLRPRLELAGRYNIISGFHRARSCIEIEDKYQIRYPGGDYITYHYYDEKMLFVVCDGVSGGFGGYIASRFLGNRLIAWLQHQGCASVGAADLLDSLAQEMNAWVYDATREVDAAPFLISPTDETDRKFKEKRRAKGAQTMFVAGVLDYRNDTADFFWMGDIRLSLDFGEDGRHIQNKVRGWSQNRWGTRDGLKGTLDGCRHRCSELRRVVVYTDGLPEIASEAEIGNWRDRDFLDLQFAQPPDDVSVLAISVVPSEWGNLPTLTVPQPILADRSEVRFSRTPEGAWIRTKGHVKDSIHAIDLDPHRTIFRPAEYDLAGRGRYGFQLISGERLPSQYTSSIPLYGKPETEPVPKSLPGLIPSRPIPTPEPPPIPQPQPRPQITFRHLLAIAGWIVAVLGWGIAAHFFFRLNQAQYYGREQQRRANELMATVTSLATLPSSFPTAQSLPPMEDATPIQVSVSPTPSTEPPSEASTAVSPLSTPTVPVISPTVLSTSVPTPVSESGSNAGDTTRTPALDSVGECRSPTTVAGGLMLHLLPSESSQIVLSVPVGHALTYSSVEGQWSLPRDEGDGVTPIGGWTCLQGLDESAGCVDA